MVGMRGEVNPLFFTIIAFSKLIVNLPTEVNNIITLKDALINDFFYFNINFLHT